MNDRLRTPLCLAVAGLVVVAGTLATGLLPQTTPYQVLSGMIIVAGFGLGFYCVGGLDGLQ